MKSINIYGVRLNADGVKVELHIQSFIQLYSVEYLLSLDPPSPPFDEHNGEVCCHSIASSFDSFTELQIVENTIINHSFSIYEFLSLHTVSDSEFTLKKIFFY